MCLNSTAIRVKYFSLFIGSQLAVVQLAGHFDLIPSISEEFLSKSLNMMALSTGIICAANWVEIVHKFSKASPSNNVT